MREEQLFMLCYHRMVLVNVKLFLVDIPVGLEKKTLQ